MLFTSLCSSAKQKQVLNFPVVEGTTENWVDEVINYAETDAVFVMFYNTSKGICKFAYPEFQTAAERMVGMVKFVGVNTHENPKVAHLYSVRAVPAFRIITPDTVIEYNEMIDSDTMVDTVQKYIPNRCALIDSTWAPSTKTPLSAIMISNKGIPPFWKAISNTYFENNTIRIGFTKKAEFYDIFKADDPTSIVFVSGTNVSIYDGSLVYHSVHDAIEEFIRNPQSKASTAPLVIEISNKNALKHYCSNTGRFCVIKGSNAKDQEFEQLAQKNKDESAPFRFGHCGETCPLNGMKDGFYIFHRKRATAIYLENVQDIQSHLDRVIDGGARWSPLKDLLSERKDEDGL